MKNKQAKQVGLWEQVKTWVLDQKDNLLYHLDDSRVQSGLYLLVFGAMLHFNCCGDPWVAVKWTVLLAGLHKIVTALRR